MSAFRRRFDRVNEIKEELLYVNYLKDDIIRGDVYPAVRDQNMCFYCGGNRLFKYDGRFSTHKKYLSLLEYEKDAYLYNDDLKNVKVRRDFSECYVDVKDKCINYSKTESKGVADLYKKYNYFNKENDVFVLDIEVCFRNNDLNSAKEKDRIDLLLYSNETKTLKFVEAKDYNQCELKNENEMYKVAEQVKRYNYQIQESISEIKEEYINYINIINDLFSMDIPKPEELSSECGLYIFGYDNDQLRGKLANVKEYMESESIKCYTHGNSVTASADTIWKFLI